MILILSSVPFIIIFCFSFTIVWLRLFPISYLASLCSSVSLIFIQIQLFFVSTKTTFVDLRLMFFFFFGLWAKKNLNLLMIDLISYLCFFSLIVLLLLDSISFGRHWEGVNMLNELDLGTFAYFLHITKNQ